MKFKNCARQSEVIAHKNLAYIYIFFFIGILKVNNICVYFYVEESNLQRPTPKKYIAVRVRFQIIFIIFFCIYGRHIMLKLLKDYLKAAI